MNNLKHNVRRLLSGIQFYWEDEFRNNILYRSSQLKFIIH